jgi:transcriptional regulator with XRE-family HTH domain
MSMASFHSGFPSSSMQSVSGSHAMQSSNFDRPCVRSERETFSEKIVLFMRRKHPSKTAERVAADTGINVHTVRKFQDRVSAPSIVMLNRLAEAYGIEFLHFVFGWNFLDPDGRAAKQRALEARFAELMNDFKNLRG